MDYWRLPTLHRGDACEICPLYVRAAAEDFGRLPRTPHCCLFFLFSLFFSASASVKGEWARARARRGGWIYSF